MTISVKSGSFNEGEMIPVRHTCDGADSSPSLDWKCSKGGIKSYALICDDPDAPAGTWVHWVVYNIPPDCTGLSEGVTSRRGLPVGAGQGMNDFQRNEYGGPCPPAGIHRYYFRIFALDCTLPNTINNKAALVKAMDGHILDSGNLMGKYRRR